jgi:Uma2 family endonuclease
MIHVRVKWRVANVLETALARSGVVVEVFGDGAAVMIADRTVHEPDAMLRLGPSLPDNDILVLDPLIVVEVLSPSTGPVDTSTKLANYFRLPSVAHYLVVNTTEKLVLHDRRGPDGLPVMTAYKDGTLTLDPPGLSLQIRDFFA